MSSWRIKELLTKRYGMLALALWLAAVGVLMAVRSRGVHAKSVELRLADGTLIAGTLYRPNGPRRPLPAVVVLHGTAMTRASCVPGLAIPLAQNGYLTLAIDLRGHGASGGSVPRSELGDLGQTVATFAEHPEIDAAIDFLKQHPLFAGERVIELTKKPAEIIRKNGVDQEVFRIEPIALVGHSRGGWAAASVGFHRTDVAGVVSLGAAPLTCDLHRPRNLLILAGGRDELFSHDRCREALVQATAGQVGDADSGIGCFWNGTARHLIKVNDVNHFTELMNPWVTQWVIEWVASSLDLDAGKAKGHGLAAVIAAVLTASVSGFLLCYRMLAVLARRMLPEAAAAGGRCRVVRLAFLFLAIVVAVHLVAQSDSFLEGGPVYFLGPALGLLTAIAVCSLIAIVRLPEEEPGGVPRRSSVLTGVAFGLIGLALGFAWIGVPWGMAWFNLVLTPRRALLAGILFPIVLPLALAIAYSLNRLLGAGPITAWQFLARWTAWLGIPVTLWFAHQWFSSSACQLFIVPIGWLAASFLLPLPLWLLPGRPGMTLARATMHAGAFVWLIACHLPFAHG